MAVDFARGYPRYRPHDDAVTRLRGGRVDAALIVGSVAEVPQPVAEATAKVPTVLIGPRASGFPGASVAIDTAIAGIHEPGTALRMDDVPLPLEAAITGPPAAADILSRLGERLRRRPRPD
jgi:formylmethanofuran dehydrogenase subunit B